MHVEQIFFANAREDPGWKVVLRKEVRSRRIHGSMGAFEDGGMFLVTEDVEHEGLRALEVILEENAPELPTGRAVRREDAFVHWRPETVEGEFDLGDSGTSEEEEDK